MKVAFLFPGQGSQYPGMLHELPDHLMVDRTLKESNEILKLDVLSLDTQEKLQSTVYVQLCLFISSVASARALQAEGAHPDKVAGHSVGGFGAAVVAGTLEFKDAIVAVKRRGELMEMAYPSGYGMGVVVGINEQRISAIVQSLSTPSQPVYVANINSPDQITIAGKVTGLEKVFEAVRHLGARRAHLLNVSVPSHCPLLESVSRELGKVLENINFQEPCIPFSGNRTGLVLRKADAIREDLVRSVSNSVRWYEAVSVLYESGVRIFVEMAPKRVLIDMIKCIFPESRLLSISENGLKSACFLIQREKKKDE